MKKFIIIAAAMLIAAVASAQPKAIGVRFGNVFEASYQHNVGNGANFIEADLGIGLLGGLHASGAYNFMIAQPEWTEKGEWGFYAGPSASASYLWYVNGASVTVGGQVGLEYTFEIPLQISLDMRPQLGAILYSGYAGFTIKGFVPCLSVRYSFGK